MKGFSHYEMDRVQNSLAHAVGDLHILKLHQLCPRYLELFLLYLEVSAALLWLRQLFNVGLTQLDWIIPVKKRYYGNSELVAYY